MNHTAPTSTEFRSMDAERLARKARLDRDRIIAVALDLLETEAHDRSAGVVGYLNYIAGSANIDRSDIDFPVDKDAYVTKLMRDIRASLSPIVLAE